MSFLHRFYVEFTPFLCLICEALGFYRRLSLGGSARISRSFPRASPHRPRESCGGMSSIVDLYAIAESRYATVSVDAIIIAANGLRRRASTLHGAARRVDFLQWENEKWFTFWIANGPTSASERLHLHAHLLFRKVFLAHVSRFKCGWGAWFCDDFPSHSMSLHWRCTRFCRIRETLFHPMWLYSRYCMPYDMVPWPCDATKFSGGLSALGSSDHFYGPREVTTGSLCQSIWVISNLNSADWGTISFP
jgi:hypothetical protein